MDIWTGEDSFIRRLKEEPRCAPGIVDFNLDKGVLRHVGIRGISEVGSIDNKRLHRFVAKYLGDDKTKWNEWFVQNIVDPLDIMVKITPKSMVAKDVSFFRTGPDLAN